MIGTLVTWAHVDTEGKPTRQLSGEVMAVGWEGARARLLVREANGTMVVCDAVDVRSLKVGETLTVRDALDSKTQLSKIATVLDELGITEEITGMSTVDGTCLLLRRLVAELKELGAALECAERERDEALAPKRKGRSPL